MSAALAVPAAAAFDALAPSYDDRFTNSSIGRAQRAAVWKAAGRVLRPGERLLELNCGTGEDALYFAAHGLRIMACDASTGMLAVCRRRAALSPSAARVEFRQLATEQLAELGAQRFDAAFSNFSGLNCVSDLDLVARALAGVLPPGAPALLCFSTRACAWELAWYGLRGDFRQATRRLRGSADATIAGHPLRVWYPTVRRIRRTFAPWFALAAIHGIGVAVPPSYAEDWVRRHRRAFALLRHCDALVRNLPLMRALGDHVLLHFRRTP